VQELQIPNGYFQLWQMFLSDRGLDGLQLDFLQDYHAQLRHVLNLPIDTPITVYIFLRGGPAYPATSQLSATGF